MCSSNTKQLQSNDVVTTSATTISDMNVLQPNRNSPLMERRSLKKTLSLPKSITMIPSPTTPKLKSPRQPAVKRGGNANDMSSSSDKLILPLPTKCPKSVIPVKKYKKCSGDYDDHLHNNSSVDTSASPNSLVVKYSSQSIVDSPGSIAAARRQQVAVMQVQRKMRIAHYGRSKSSKYDSSSSSKLTSYNTFHPIVKEDKRCSFITPNSDPIYVAYHDEEWGVPAHDDKEAFSGFDADIVSKYSVKKITSISSEYSIEVSLVRGVIDNSKAIIEINKALGSFNNYIWGFVNHKPIATQYKSSHKMPVKTSKAESISKDMVRRGFRQVGPTVIHSFMQAAGLTNDHLTTCPRHNQCVALASSTTSKPLVSVN